MRKEKRRDRSAFTFLELIISVTVFSIIAISIYAVLRGGMRTWTQVSPMIESNQARRFFFNMIATDLRNAVIYADVSGTSGGTTETANFEGDGQKISFWTLINVTGPNFSPGSELVRASYYFEQENRVAGSSTELVKTVKRVIAGKDYGLDTVKAKPVEVMTWTDERNIVFEYCYKDIVTQGSGTPAADEYTYKWKDTWQDTAKVPRGVRIKLGESEKVVFIPIGELGQESAAQ